MRAEALKELGDHPSTLRAYEPDPRGGAAPGAQTLLIPPPRHAHLALQSGLLLGRMPAGTIALLRGWAARQPEGWDLPGSPQRKALRAALGGRLVQWLAKSER